MDLIMPSGHLYDQSTRSSQRFVTCKFLHALLSGHLKKGHIADAWEFYPGPMHLVLDDPQLIRGGGPNPTNFQWLKSVQPSYGRWRSKPTPCHNLFDTSAIVTN